MESDAYEDSVKKSKETMETFRDTIGPMKSYNHVFEATTSIGKFSMSFLQRWFVCRILSCHTGMLTSNFLSFSVLLLFFPLSRSSSIARGSLCYDPEVLS